MKPQSAESEYVLLKHWARAKGFSYQTLRDAAARREFDVVSLGNDKGRRQHAYAKRVELAAWLDSRTRRKQTTSQIHAA